LAAVAFFAGMLVIPLYLIMGLVYTAVTAAADKSSAIFFARPGSPCDGRNSPVAAPFAATPSRPLPSPAGKYLLTR
jgi:hypothetical protein